MHFRSFLRHTATRLAGALAFAAFGSLAAHAYDSIVVFGDSYNDVGNIYALAAQFHVVYPPPPYYQGRFSNGPIWIEHIANDWGLPLKPSALGGSDYAVGGAQLLQAVTIDGLPIPSIQDQVAYYLATHGGKADPKTLYVIEGGGNDILASTDLTEGPLALKLAATILGIQTTLRKAGAKSFLIPDSLDIAQLPAAAVASKTPAQFLKWASDTTILLNETVDHALAVEALTPGLEIYRTPIFRTFLAVANSKTHFGFKNVTIPCLGAQECADPDHTLWWDGEHPTEFAHAFFAVLVEGVVNNH